MVEYDSLIQAWVKLLADFENAEKTHEEYLRDQKETNRLQINSAQNVKTLLKSSGQIRNDLKKLEQMKDNQKEKIEEMNKRMIEVRTKLGEMQRELPADSNGFYLKIILGSNLNVSLLNPDDRYRYKEEYESFKMTVTYFIILTLFLAYVFPYRAMDAICNFLMVWYYCTLTIREAILRVNGSRIKGWWVAHHYISTVLCGIILTWRDDHCYKQFRALFIILSAYIGVVQLMQCRYQTGCLRRLHALGQRHSMDITVEGFSSWMFKGLTFLLPFLTVAYIIQGYCSYKLFYMYFYEECNEDWQVLALAFLFAVVSLGNSITILRVVFRKIQERYSLATATRLVSKYRPKTV